MCETDILIVLINKQIENPFNVYAIVSKLHVAYQQSPVEG